MLNIFAQSMLTATRLEQHNIKEIKGKGAPSQTRRKWWRKPSQAIDLNNL